MRKSGFCARLGLEAPIVQAPMASSTTPALVAAVSNAGGLGSHGCASLAPEKLTEEIAAIRSRTTRGFNLNFFTHQAPVPDAAKEAAMAALLEPYHAELGLGDVLAARARFRIPLPRVRPRGRPSPAPGRAGARI